MINSDNGKRLGQTKGQGEGLNCEHFTQQDHCAVKIKQAESDGYIPAICSYKFQILTVNESQ